MLFIYDVVKISSLNIYILSGCGLNIYIYQRCIRYWFYILYISVMSFSRFTYVYAYIHTYIHTYMRTFIPTYYI
jgi:hypothetical protein